MPWVEGRICGHTAASQRLKYSSLDVSMGMHRDESTKGPWSSENHTRRMWREDVPASATSLLWQSGRPKRIAVNNGLVASCYRIQIHGLRECIFSGGMTTPALCVDGLVRVSQYFRQKYARQLPQPKPYFCRLRCCAGSHLHGANAQDVWKA